MRQVHVFVDPVGSGDNVHVRVDHKCSCHGQVESPFYMIKANVPALAGQLRGVGEAWPYGVMGNMYMLVGNVNVDMSV